MTSRDTPGERAAEGYDELAERAEGDHDPAGGLWGDSSFQRFYAWPASVETLPEVTGERVLVAGAGTATTWGGSWNAARR